MAIRAHRPGVGARAGRRAREGRAEGTIDARCGRGTRETKRSGCGLSFVDSKIVFIKMQSSKLVERRVGRETTRERRHAR